MHEQKEKKEFKLAPEGTYTMRIENILSKDGKRGGTFDSYKFNIMDLEYSDINVFENIFTDYPENPVVVTFGDEKKKRIAAAVGLSISDEPNMYLGKRFLGVVKKELGRDGITRNKISKYTPLPKDNKFSSMPEIDSDLPF